MSAGPYACPGVFERFTEPARQVVVHSQAAAVELGHEQIATEHVLLGLLGVEGSVAARALASLGVTIEPVREYVLQVVGSEVERAPAQIPFTPEAKRVLELALRESLDLGHNFIGPEHLLLGLARENSGVGAQALREFGATPGAIRNEVVRMLCGPGEYQQRPGAVGAPAMGGFPESVFDGARRLLAAVTQEVEDQLGRQADAGDLLVVLACADGMAADALSRLGVDASALAAVADAARSEGARPGLALRDAERAFAAQARKHEQRTCADALAEARRRLRLAGE